MPAIDSVPTGQYSRTARIAYSIRCNDLRNMNLSRLVPGTEEVDIDEK
jgi:hypothetical protein